jgi:hypothetical protein
MKRWNMVLICSVALLLVFVAFINRRAAEPQASKGQGTLEALAKMDGTRAPVLVELFTSEGCSSCPPADELLMQLDRTQPITGVEVIALSQHVDYWNRLGWADPYSSAEFSSRQGDYSRAFSQDGVYTPQMVVDGRAEFVGSNQSRAREAIISAARSPKATITLKRSDPAGDAGASTIPLEVRIEKLPPVSAGDIAEVLLAVTESDLRSEVSRGENSGRRLTHTAVVRQLSMIGTTADATAQAFTASPAVTIKDGWKRVNLRAIAFVQERASRKVLGAATISLAVAR